MMNEEFPPSARSYRWLLWVVALAALAADQWSKSRIIQSLAIGETWRPLASTPVLELFAFTHTKNSGAAFGFFQTGGWFFVIVAAVVSTLIAIYVPRLPRQQWWLFLSLGLILGGAMGNLVDRLRIGWVTDFIHIGSFAIFNVADSAIFCGVSILFVHFWREDRQAKQLSPDDPAPPASPTEAPPSATPSSLGTGEGWLVTTPTPPLAVREARAVFSTNGHSEREAPDSSFSSETGDKE